MVMSFLFYVVLTLGVTLAGLLLFSLLDMAQKREESLDRLELETLRTKEQTFSQEKVELTFLSAPPAADLYHDNAPPTRLCNRR
jgi:hypothetical protein